MSSVKDTLGRTIRDLRISVTDRCNFRCTYCMPKNIFNSDYPFLARGDLLSFEEIARLARLFAAAGVQKLRITGGEPLLRKKLEALIAELAVIDSITDISLTTNASILTPELARKLRHAGLHRITVSLDAMDDAIFKRMNDKNIAVDQVLRGVENAVNAGFTPIKINMVVQKGVNDHQVLPLAEHFRHSGHIVRFIEYMDVGTTNGWKMQHVVPAQELIEQIGRRYPIVPVDANYQGEVAKRWRYQDGGGEIGFITSVTQPFCGDCSRARLSAEGSLYTCLFANKGTDLRHLLRNGAADDYISEVLASVWKNRTDRYSELRSKNSAPLNKVEMSYIGG